MGNVRTILTVLVLTAALLGIAAPLALAQAQAGKKVTVSIKDQKFAPDTIAINVGDTVTWTNNDDRDHLVVASDNSFKSENLRAGASFSVTFKKAGTFAYTCSYHPREKGTVKVTEK